LIEKESGKPENGFRIPLESMEKFGEGKNVKKCDINKI
jgi:hypothetical protein